MKISFLLLLAIVICSIGWTEAQFTNVSCSASSQCWPVCKKLFGTYRGKCMNSKCRCYS
uniref:Potassium channel toxin alpha-KTx 1.6 n=2 Tax=Olivierus martensii TaxID=34649 RepID=KAX16_OLIMR|nr:RecName: Full=Potassium channel toxin alpha-KTx 1.6; AltName: Full=BmTX2; AltName: Full=Neurotoxin TX2; Flags: Precursor [Mesobuthus martensii]AAF63972.1 neurotoxin TX2 [Mesobuthus martensii]AAK73518.1 potassium channel toxin Bmtx2 [Mesobuthus martensii]AAQ13576.1 potassium channel toxin precursor [Mesobuthus martensii]AAX56614.1 potassium channel toxin BmKTX2' [Mesobuthus martensii]AFR43616.1 toxin BmTX2 [Mesobuthus martensii]